jgi:glycosyltransferase involved in cell wall biosynthesis
MNKSNTKKPFFSIVIPTLDEEICLPLILGDLSKQSWTDFEVIHVDGGSADKTLEKSKQWQDKLDLTIINHDIKNVASQRNRGALAAKGDWVVFMDADNRIPSYFLVGLRYRIEKAESQPKKRFDLFSTLIHLNNDDKSDKKSRTSAKTMNFFIRATSTSNKPLVPGSMIGIRRQIIDNIRFNEKSKVSEDSIFVKDCIKAGFNYQLINHPTYAFSMRRVKSNGIIKTAASGFIMNLKYSLGNDLSGSDYGYKMLGGSAYIDKPKSKIKKGQKHASKEDKR